MPDPIPPQAPAAEAPPKFDFASAVQRAMDQGQAEIADAQRQRAAMLEQSGTGMTAVAHGPEAAIALHKQLRANADRPVQDAIERHEARGRALDEVAQQGKIAGQGAEYEEFQVRRDKGSPVSQAAQETAIKAGVPQELARQMSAYQLEAAIPGMKGFADTYGTRAAGKEKEASAQNLQAQAAATTGKAGIEAAAAPGLRAQTEQATRKTAAEAKQAESLAGDTGLPPGYARGPVGMTAEEQAKLRSEVRAGGSFESSINKLKAIMGPNNLVVDPTKRSLAKEQIESLRMQLKAKYGIKNPETLKEMVPDPTSYGLVNILGITKNLARLEAMKKEDADTTTAAWEASGQIRKAGEPEKRAEAAPAVRKVVKGKTYEKRGSDWYAVK